MIDKRLMLLALSFFSVATDSIADHNNYSASIGAGFGLPYGVIGAKIDYSPIKNLYLSLGIGVASSSTKSNASKNSTEYAAGLQYYFRAQDKVWRPRVSIFYGVVEFLDVYRDDDEVHELFYGSAIELGSSIQFGYNRQHGVDVGVIIPLTDGGKDAREKELIEQGYSECCGADIGEVFYHFAVGYRLNF
ncbi:MAG: hypothetical protein OEZ33_08660 [Gammaproteobacteria bacterium]|nr:hypothetical protein [Gammaproteobacteria bacterium]MDH5778269.1 hypothetical protein [Gammaproteobacteria bacterium]